VIDKSKTEKKKIILSPENKKDLREFLNEKQKWLEKNAEREKKYAGDNPAAITKSLIQTVPNSYKEVDNLTYRTFEKYFEVKQVVNNFTNEMDKNPLEGLKMLGNVETAVQNIKKSASDYISDGRLKNDLYNAGKNVVNTNVEFVSNLIKNPGKTITTYVNTAVGSENWKNSWDMNKPLETRLLNAGAGIIKTCSTLGSLNMAGGLLKGAPTVKGFLSANVINSLKVNWILLMHQKNMYMHKLEQMFPGLLSEAKFKFVYNLTKVELNHYVNHPDSNAPMVENVNDWLENFNKSFGKKN
ncbi:MAG: hypothetical protein NTV87_11205, partial [Ignavibacteriae bacterium]|nr:hypothetical protein [Ignavibacteriota bacterium]